MEKIMATLEHYPTLEEIKKLSGNKGVAVTIYRQFEIIAWRKRWRSEITALIKTAIKDAGWDHKTRGTLLSKLEEEITSLSLSKPYLAVFLDKTNLYLYNTYNRMDDEVFYGEYFSVTKLLRTITNPRRAFVVTLSLNNWDVYEFDGPEAPKLLKIDKGNFGSYDKFTAGVVGKHIVQRAHQDLRHEHERRFAGKIADVVKKTAQQKPIILMGDIEIVSNVKNSLGIEEEVYVVHKNISDINVEADAQPILDEIFNDFVEARLDKIFGLEDDGYAINDLSSLGWEAVNGNVEELYVSHLYAVDGTFSQETGTLSYEGSEPVVSKIIESVLNTDGKVYILRDEDVKNPHWDSTFLGLRRWVAVP